ncbi:MAG: hypothetical protein LBJ46_06615 [Planctomycetota bacterium]|jgi:hypothetical protein|nr:hypothetical protein [Planctomycetota bacterium]
MFRHVVLLGGLVIACVATAFARVHAQEVPLLSDLRRKVEAAPVEEMIDSARPAPVTGEKMFSDLLRLAPDGAVWYFSCNDFGTAADNWDETPVARFLAEQRVQNMLRNNQFSIATLFGDLPRAVILQERVAAADAAIGLAARMAPFAKSGATVGYVNEDGDFSFLFLLDIGSRRDAPFDAMVDWETALFLSSPGTSATRGDHSGSFLDVWSIPLSAAEDRKAEVAAGFHENIAVITSDSALGRRVFAQPGNGESLADSPYGTRLAASSATSADSDFYGFVRIRALLSAFSTNRVTHDALVAWANMVGGVTERDALYYSVRMVRGGARETYLVPLGGNGATVARTLAGGLRPAQKWTAPSAFPYQPAPSRYFSAVFDKPQISRMLRMEYALFGEIALPDSILVPQEGLQVFSEAVLNSLTGEVATAYFSADYDQPNSSWMTVLAAAGDISSVIPGSVSQVEKSGITIHSVSRDWRTAVSWAVIPESLSKNLQSSFLVFASSGDLISGAIEQIFSGLTFADNRDFNAALASAEDNQGMLFYLNVPEIAVREYPNLSVLARTFFPRSSGLNNRPPLNLLRRYAAGLLAVVSPGSIENEFLRVTVQAPFPSLGAISLMTVLNYPSSLRISGREGMAKSRTNMQKLWLRLQLFSSRNGHFPVDVDELVADMRTSMTNDEIRDIFTAPGAVYQLGRAEATRSSYHYVSGLTPNDEPDVPLIYETRPWGEDFVGMQQPKDNAIRRETGNFEQYRQYIRMDGEVIAVPERIFHERVLKRLEDRE